MIQGETKNHFMMVHDSSEVTLLYPSLLFGFEGSGLRGVDGIATFVPQSPAVRGSIPMFEGHRLRAMSCFCGRTDVLTALGR